MYHKIRAIIQMNRSKVLENKEEIAFHLLHKSLKPQTYLQVGIDYGKYMKFASCNTKCIGIGNAVSLKYPVSPLTRLFKYSSQYFFSNYNLRNEFGGEEVDLVFINHYKNITELETILNSILEFSTKKTPILIRVNNEQLDTTNLIEQLGWDMNTKMTSIGNQKYLTVSRASLDDYNFGDPKEINKYNLKQYRYYSKIQLKENPEAKEQKNPDKPKCLGVLLCYNDGDILEETILHLLKNNHELVVWDHSSNDSTSKVLDKYKKHFVERKLVSRDFDFYHLYQSMSKNLIDNYIDKYDIISWPDQDELQEGPNRDKSYYEHLCEFFNSGYDWIRFNNFVYWYTPEDDLAIKKPTQRIRYYGLYPDCSPRIRAWKTEATNIRFFNHNNPRGRMYPENFNLRHYPMRTKIQLERRIKHDRKDIAKPNMHFHYYYMGQVEGRTAISSSSLYRDDGISDLSHKIKFSWRQVYGSRKKLKNEQNKNY